MQLPGSKKGDIEIVQTLSAQLTWSHNRLLLDKTNPHHPNKWMVGALNYKGGTYETNRTDMYYIVPNPTATI